MKNFKHSQQTKKRISQKRKQYIKQHPESFAWRRADKFKSKPCEDLKQFLIDNNIHFYPQYQNYQLFNHRFAIDIAFPNQKIAIEVNGTQHYNRDGTLTPYFQQRHDILQKAGWRVQQIPYNKTYNQEVRQSLLKLIKDNVDFTYDYSQQIKQFLRQKQLQHICPICGGEKKDKRSKTCKKCVKRQCKNIPSKQQILKDIQQLQSIAAIGRKYNKTDNAVKRWMKKYNIPCTIKDIKNNIVYQYQGQKYLLSQLAKKFNINLYTLRLRIHKGYSIKEAIQYQKPRTFQITKQQLQQDLNSGLTKSDIARKYNKSFAWVRRWCNKFNL